MKKHIKRIVFLTAMVIAVWFAGILADSAQLREDILRLHVVANSDSGEDQAVKLQVRDAVLASLRDGLSDVTDVEQAEQYIRSMIPKLKQAADQTLKDAGFDETVSISLESEEFPMREYDTFSLPSGLYRALRVVIGEGEGKNWWCVVFPELCTPATAQEFTETANMEGFSDSLSGSLAGEYEVRFWLLDQIGKFGNFIHWDF